jgi:hypothetical protein
MKSKRPVEAEDDGSEDGQETGKKSSEDVEDGNQASY